VSVLKKVEAGARARGHASFGPSIPTADCHVPIATHQGIVRVLHPDGLGASTGWGGAQIKTAMMVAFVSQLQQLDEKSVLIAPPLRGHQGGK
jgi:hypothetical protein